MARRYSIEADILPANPRPSDKLARTSNGLQIGVAYQRPPQAATSRDAERLQRALLNKRERVDWDGIVIAVFITACALAAIFA